MKMFIDSMCVGTYPNKITEQVFEYFDYLANLTSDWACTGTQNNVTKPTISMPTQHVGTKYQVASEDDINAKLTSLTKQVEALAFAKDTIVVSKETSTICALCDIMGHSNDICPIVVGVKKAHGQVNVVNQFLRSGNNPFSNTYNPGWRNHHNFGWRQKGQQNTQQF